MRLAYEAEHGERPQHERGQVGQSQFDACAAPLQGRGDVGDDALRSVGSGGSPRVSRAKSRNWPMILSISSMSALMPSRKAASALISAARRKRVSGVRRSCEMPARMRARSSSRRARSLDIWLKACVTLRISPGPVSVSGCGLAAAADVMRCVGQRLERARHAEHDEVGAGQRQQQGSRSPPQPLQREFSLDALARQHQPVLVVL